MGTTVETVAAITTICYLVGIGAKTSPINNKYIPVIVGVAGGIIGIAGMFVIEGFPANDVITALAVGIASGLASTGANQVVKQLKFK